MLFASTTAAGAEGWDEGSIVAQALDSGRGRFCTRAAPTRATCQPVTLCMCWATRCSRCPSMLRHWRCVGGPIPVVPKSGALSVPTLALPSTRYLGQRCARLRQGRRGERVELVSGRPIWHPQAASGIDGGDFPPQVQSRRLENCRSSRRRRQPEHLDLRSVAVSVAAVDLRRRRSARLDARRSRHYLPEGTSLWQIPSDFSGAGAPLPGTDVGQLWSVRLVAEWRRPVTGIARGSPCVSGEGRCGRRGGFRAAADESAGRDHAHLSSKLFTGWSLARACRHCSERKLRVCESVSVWRRRPPENHERDCQLAGVEQKRCEIFLITTDGQ